MGQQAPLWPEQENRHTSKVLQHARLTSGAQGVIESQGRIRLAGEVGQLKFCSARVEDKFNVHLECLSDCYNVNGVFFPMLSTVSYTVAFWLSQTWSPFRRASVAMVVSSTLADDTISRRQRSPGPIPLSRNVRGPRC